MKLETLTRNQRLNQIVVLAAILIVAAVLRFASLAQRGLIYWDEAKFSLEGVRLHAYIQSWFGSSALNAGKTIGTAKPTHALLIAFADFIFGIHTYVPLFLDAFCGVAGVGVAFLLGRRLFGPWAGLIGALFLAVSEYDAIYARSALSESDANLLFLLAVFFWVIDWERVAVMVPSIRGKGVAAAAPERVRSTASGVKPTWMLIVAGILAGASFTTNYRLGVYVLGLVAFDLFWCFREYRSRAAVRRFLIWIPSCAAFPVLWQLIDFVARLTGHVLFRSEVNILVKSGGHVILKSAQHNQPEWYLQQMLFQLHGSGGSAGFHFDPWIYLQWFVVREGWLIPVLFLVGLAFAIRARQFAWLGPVVLVLFPYLIYMFAPYVVPRNLSAAIPFVCLLAAAGLVAAAERIRIDVARRLVIVGLGCAVAIYGGILTWRLTGERSGFADAAAYVQQHRGKVLGSNEVMVWYFPGPANTLTCGAPGLPGTLRQLAADRAGGFTYAETETIDHGMADWLATHATPIATWPAWGNITIGENPVGTENGYPPRQRAETVSLYDLRKLNLPSPGNAAVSTCIRNVPI